MHGPNKTRWAFDRYKEREPHKRRLIEIEASPPVGSKESGKS
jgi:hypothetical protein